MAKNGNPVASMENAKPQRNQNSFFVFLINLMGLLKPLLPAIIVSKVQT
jgi:hypothetical protein